MARKLVLCLLVALVASAVVAQEATPEATPEVSEAPTFILSYGTPATGEITAEAAAQNWTLRTASADRVRVEVIRTSGTLVPEVAVLSESGNELRGSWGATATFDRAVIEDLALPSAGTYTISVGRYQGDNGATVGEYTVTVTPLGTGEENPNNQTVIGEVLTDETVSGEITATRWLHRYTYTAAAADILRITATRTRGTLMPEVAILDANGGELRRGYYDDGSASAQIDSIALTSAGTYTIVVSRVRGQGGSSLGVYDLTVELRGAGEGSPSLSGSVGEIVYDTPFTGTLTNAQWYHDYALTAEAGDALNLTVTRTDGTLVPELALLGGSLQELRRGFPDDDQASSSFDYTLGSGGSYTVRVLRQRGQDGETSGDYELRVNLVGAGEGSEALNVIDGTAVVGEPITGEITASRWLNTWTFTGAPDTRYDIVVTRADGTLVPMLEIRDVNGQSVRTAFPADTYDRAELLNYALPGAGEFRIVVTRERGLDGLTTGAYELVITPNTN